ncbi:MAG: CTP synthase [Rubrivivax sp.]|nr:CTP synthase [Rubrivivax sp.]
MNTELRVGLVGDHDEAIPAHRAIPLALALAAADLGCAVRPTWLHTDTLIDPRALEGYDALWCVPGSPYRSMDGALRAIRFAREQGTPFLGTCGGFQHAVLEYARHVLGWADAEHAETAPQARRAVIQALACALVEADETLVPAAGSRLGRAHGDAEFQASYRCRYGLNPAFEGALLGGALQPAARNSDGELRALELDGHPFFVITLFQPEREALQGRLPPLVQALLRAAQARSQANEEARRCS